MDGIRGAGGGHEAGTAPRPPGRARRGRARTAARTTTPARRSVLGSDVLEAGAALRRNDARGDRRGYVNAICDARVDSQETSTQCLSYDYKTQSTARRARAARPREQAVAAEISPLRRHQGLFGGSRRRRDLRRALRVLKPRKSVLDYALRELDRLKTLGPGSEGDKIDVHAAAMRKSRTSSAIRSRAAARPPRARRRRCPTGR